MRLGRLDPRATPAQLVRRDRLARLVPQVLQVQLVRLDLRVTQASRALPIPFWRCG